MCNADSPSAAPFEAFLADEASLLFGASGALLDGRIIETQRRLCRMIGMDRSSIWQGSEREPDRLRVTHIASLQEARIAVEHLVANDDFPWITAQLLRGELVAIPDVNALPPEAAVDREMLLQIGTRSTLIVPFPPGPDPVRGAMTFGAMTRHRDWPAEVITHGRLVTQVIGSVLARRRADEQLRKLWRAVEQAPATIVITDPTGAIEYANPYFTRVTGYAVEEALGKNPRILKSPETPPETHRALWQTITAGGQWEGDFRNRRKDGGLFWEHAVISPVRDEAGRTTHFVAVKRDITEQKEAEEELRRVREQFLQSQKMEAMGRLASGVAHDFNNLLAVICALSSDVLERLPAGSLEATDLREVVKAGEKAAQLTMQLLTFTRQQPRHPRVVDIGAVVRDAEKLLRRVMREDVALRLDCAPDLPVLADPAQIHQVIVNLAVNGRDAMPRGGHLHIEAREVVIEPGAPATSLLPGRYAMLAVRDTGEGIAPEILPRVFEPFFTTKERGKGTGLGLSTVLGIVKQSGGDIRIESRPGEGTRVTVLLPRAALPAEREPPALTDQSRGRGETVLCVEDDPDVRAVVQRMVTSLGYQVLTAAGGEEALALLDSHPGIDLLLTDVVMPGMSGAQLARLVRQLRPHMAILFTSGFSDVPGEELDGLASGPLITKPYTRHQVAQAVRAALEQKAKTAH